MTEYHEMVQEAAEARIGADRMAMGLSCIPDKLRGDMAEIERLTAALQAITDLCKTSPADPFLADNMDRVARRALEPKP